MIRDLGVVDVSADPVARILVLEETHFLDLKAREITGPVSSSMLRLFANGAGGEVYVGVDELAAGGRAWRGFNTVEEANGHVQALHDAFQGNNVLSVSFLRGAGVTGFVTFESAPRRFL